jgi:hypothetical protein
MPSGKPLGLYILNPDMCIVELKIFNEKPSICTGAPVMREADVVPTDLIIRFIKIVIHTKEMATIPGTIRNFFINTSLYQRTPPQIIGGGIRKNVILLSLHNVSTGWTCL